jgi:hypothetical protein
MTDTQNIDDSEKLNIIFKEILGFPSTSENISYYEELNTKFNTYTLSENVLLENITQCPDFDIHGNIKSANEIGLNPNDFINYTYDVLNKSQSSIVDDSTGTVRRFKYLKLQQTYGTENSNYGASWFKLDNSYNNVLEDSLQYNYKSYYDLSDGNALKLPYLYEVFTENSLQVSSVLHNLPFGIQGGNWVYNYKNGILFFSDFNNLAQQNIYGGIYNINNNNKPVISVYKYIGKKNINNLTRDIDKLKYLFNNNASSNNIFTKILTYTQNLTNKISKLEDTVYTNTSNKIQFTSVNFTTTTSNLIDLSNSFFNTITIYNTNNTSTNILVNINATLYCSYDKNERITVQVWRDLSMIAQHTNLGSTNHTGGMTIPYNLTYLDENISCGIKKYYLKYQLETTPVSSHPPQGIINVRTSQTQGSSDILLREIKIKTNYRNTIIFTNKLLFDANTYTTLTANIIDLSNSLYNTIGLCNTIYILVNVNVTITCSYAYNERINIELWRDISMVMQDSIFGSANATSGLTMSYNFTYLDDNYNNSPKKYYLKYKLDNNNSNQEQGIVNIRTSIINGSSSILLKEYQNISNFTYNNIFNNIEFTNNTLTTNTNNLIDLSNSFYNIINPCNNSNILVNIKASLYCSYAYNERITIQLWRDLSMLVQDCSLGSLNATGGLNLSYNMTYLDENINSGENKYYLKYKLDNNNSAKEQGLINIKTNNNNSSSRILLREITNTHNISNKTIFNNTNYTTSTSELIDLSNAFFNTITICNNNTNILVNVKATLYCSYAYKERITIELWRDSNILIQDCSIGIINSTNGLTTPYNLTYLDENINSGTVKYYLKYKLEKNITGEQMGIINIKTSSTNGSSSIILRQI